MQHLSALDALFLYLETPEMPMHVGSLILFEKPKGHRGSFCKKIRAHVAARMNLAPLFTRKLAFMPLDLANPVWVKGGRVDIDRHITRMILPKPGDSLENIARSLLSKIPGWISLGPRSPLNVAIGPERDFVGMRIPLAETKAIARHFDAKLNDVALAICAAAMRAYFPVSIVVHGLALNITILSYNGSMDYGLIACKRTVTRLQEFAEHLQAAHRELLDLVRADLAQPGEVKVVGKGAPEKATGKTSAKKVARTTAAKTAARKGAEIEAVPRTGAKSKSKRSADAKVATKKKRA